MNINEENTDNQQDGSEGSPDANGTPTENVGTDNGTPIEQIPPPAPAQLAPVFCSDPCYLKGECQFPDSCPLDGKDPVLKTPDQILEQINNEIMSKER